jgi:hypothetical protein
MYSRLALLLYVITKCYCFPTFKELFSLFRRPFFNWECKGSRYFYSSKFFFGFFSAESFFQTKILCLLFEELSAFFEAGCKYRKLSQLNPNNYLKDIHIYPQHLFQYPPFIQRKPCHHRVLNNNFNVGEVKNSLHLFCRIHI